MTHVVNNKCVDCKYTYCVEVCPVSCFYEGKNRVVINPDECIDCGVCIPECPVEAIEPEKPELANLVIEARKLSQNWPRITEVKPSNS